MSGSESESFDKNAYLQIMVLRYYILKDLLACFSLRKVYSFMGISVWEGKIDLFQKLKPNLYKLNAI